MLGPKVESSINLFSNSQCETLNSSLKGKGKRKDSFPDYHGMTKYRKEDIDWNKIHGKENSKMYSL